MKPYWFLLGLLVLVDACADIPWQEVPPDGNFLTLPPASLGHDLSLSQLVTGEYDGTTYKARYEIDITRQRLAVVGLSPLGVTLFTIVQENGDVKTQTFGIPAKVDPRYVLSDIYIAYWTPATLRPALKKMGRRIEVTEDGAVRRVRNAGDELLVEVRYNNPARRHGRIDIRHFDFPYRLRIEPLAPDKSP